MSPAVRIDLGEALESAVSSTSPRSASASKKATLGLPSRAQEPACSILRITQVNKLLASDFRFFMCVSPTPYAALGHAAACRE
jgi:hypothetical protein